MLFTEPKNDSSLGTQIHNHLVKMGVQTPMLAQRSVSSQLRQQKILAIETHFKAIMETLNLDLSDDSLSESPLRVAKMMVNEAFWGLNYSQFPKCTTVLNKMKYKQMVCEKGISVQSHCQHHFVAISGTATVAYIPKDKVLGLSKINRIVDYFSRRPQIQQRLTEQIFHSLQYILQTEDVAVLIDAQHFCVKSRGVEHSNASTITSSLGGVFKSDVSTRQEFYHNAQSTKK